MAEKIRAEFSIKGLVQGVGFRYYIYRHANSLGITGYAKNLYDGSVEAVAEGDKKDIETLKDFLRQGPSHSRVEDLKVQYFEPKGEFKNFDIRH